MSVRLGSKNPFGAIPTPFDEFSDGSSSPLVPGCAKGQNFVDSFLELVPLNTTEKD